MHFVYLVVRSFCSIVSLYSCYLGLCTIIGVVFVSFLISRNEVGIVERWEGEVKDTNENTQKNIY